MPVLTNPLDKELFDQVSSLGYILGVLLIGEAQLQMVGTTFQDSHGDVGVSWNFMEKATSTPWVKVAISEHDVGCVQEILVGVAATECVQSPVELRVQPGRLFAACNEGISVPEVSREHVSDAILLNWHDHFIAYLVAPAIVIQTRSGLV